MGLMGPIGCSYKVQLTRLGIRLTRAAAEVIFVLVQKGMKKGNRAKGN
jgi:hypothetical protein